MAAESQERWREIEKLLDEALDGATGPPGSGLDTQPGATSGARSAALRLLRFREDARHFLVSPAAELFPGVAAADPLDDAAEDGPERIGPYRILREAGRGGMATVYLAEREDPELRVRVAVKVIRDAIASRALVRRFIRERQILASLDHPGMARLLDGGITDEGLPWFAMEYVDGVPITRYCDERRLGIDARLELFLRVCEAVQYAHGRLVVHRDLKPSNILVSEASSGRAAGQVKLLDFGIARLLDPESTLGTCVTRTVVVPLTPEYASPEQLRGEPASTASDVYQLGVLLYELLTGRRPYELADLPRHDAYPAVQEELPANPSYVVTGRRPAGIAERAARGPTAASVGHARATRPDTLRRRLRGDLDTICLMALQRAPERRYASVERLAEDVRRHLRREPVSARPDSVLYRSGRFIRRHRVGVASAGLTFVLLASLAATMTVQAGRIARERDRAEQATAFLVDLFQAFEPLEARGSTVPVADVLRRGVERARAELAGQPLLRARVLEGIAEVFELQGLHFEAEPLLEEALDTRLAALGPEHLDVARGRARLAGLRYERGGDDAEWLYRSALATLRARLDSEAPEVVRAQIGLALSLRARGSYAVADSMLREALGVTRAGSGLDLEVPIVLTFLGKLRTREGDLGEAEGLLREALARRLALLGEVHPAVANTHDALGELELARGHPEAAERAFVRALAIRRELYDDDHTDVASGLTYLARARAERGDLVAADTLLGKVMPIFRRAFGEESPDVAEVLEHLATVRAAGGDPVAADSLYGRALAIWRSKDLEATHDRPATLLVLMGALHMRNGELEDARSLLVEGLALRKASLPEGHWQVAEAASLLGACLSLLGRFEEAEPLLIEGHAAVAKVRGANDRLTRQALGLLSEHLGRSGRPRSDPARAVPSAE